MPLKVTSTGTEILITLPKGILSVSDVQYFLDLMRYKELVNKSQASDEEVNEVISDIKSSIGKRTRQFWTS
ncbi:MAG: hypothetical protein AAF740_13440 [Bacteroidota bacterium]